MNACANCGKAWELGENQHPVWILGLAPDNVWRQCDICSRCWFECGYDLDEEPSADSKVKVDE